MPPFLFESRLAFVDYLNDLYCKQIELRVVVQNSPRQHCMERLGNIVRAERRVVLTPEVHRERAEPNVFKITVHRVRVGVVHHCLVFMIIEDLLDSCFWGQ